MYAADVQVVTSTKDDDLITCRRQRARYVVKRFGLDSWITTAHLTFSRLSR